MSLSPNPNSFDESELMKFIEKEVTNDKSRNEIFRGFQSLNSKSPSEYYSVLENSDIMTIDHPIPFPSELETIFHSNHFSHSDFGYLPELHRYYAAFDKTLYMWSISENLIREKINESDEITVATIIVPDKKIHSDNTVYFLVVATLSYIKAYPVINHNLACSNPSPIFDFSFDFTTFYIQKTDFIPTALSRGDDGILLVGGADERLYIIQFSDTPSMKSVGLDLFKLTQSLLSTPSPITKILYDRETSSLAMANSNGTIYFYNLKSAIFYYSGKYTLPPDSKLVDLWLISNSESQKIRFIAFDQHGTRYFFGYSYLPISTSIELRCVRPPPVELTGCIVYHAFYSLGFTIFITNDQIVALRACNTFNRVCEHVITMPFEIKNSDKILCGGFPIHPFSSFFTLAFKSPALWQYAIDPPIIYLLTSASSMEFHFHLPYENIINQFAIEQNQNIQNFTLSEFLLKKLAFDEDSTIGGISTILMAAAVSSGTTRSALLMAAYKYSVQQKDKSKNVLPSDAFILMTTRLLELILDESLFMKSSTLLIFSVKYEIGKRIQQLPNDYIRRLQSIITLSNEYIKQRKENMDTFQKSEINEIQNEGIKIEALTKFLKAFIEEIRILQLIQKQPDEIISAALNDIDSNSFNRLFVPLSKILFQQGNQLLILTLRSFVSQFFKKAPKDSATDYFATQISSECPLFTRAPEALIANALSDLEMALNLPFDSRGEILSSSEHVFLALTDQQIDLDQICGLFIRLGAPNRAVHIAVSRASHIDPNRRALAWYLSGCSSKDEKGEDIFKKLQRYCYEPIHDAIFDPAGKLAIEKADDEMLHYHVFQYLIDIDETEKLMDFQSPVLESFLKNLHREILYKFYIKKQRYLDAANELLTFAQNANESTLEQRIQWVEEALLFATGVDNSREKTRVIEEARAMLRSAKISGKIKGETQIKDYVELMQHAFEEKDWQSILEIEAVQPSVDEKARKDDIQHAWKKLLEKESVDKTPSQLSLKIESILRPLSEKNSIVTNPKLIVPVFEDFKNENHYPMFWAGELLGHTIPNTFQGYSDIINNVKFENDLTKDNKYELVIIAMKLLENGNLGEYNDIEDAIDELLHDQSHPLFNQANTIQLHLENS